MQHSPPSDPASLYRIGLRADFYTFVKQVFRTVDPGTDFVGNWHLDAICHEVMDFLGGSEQRLVVNVPPRSLKSIIISVALPAYLLGRDPSRKIICVSYSSELSDKHASLTRRVMEAAWYRQAFPRALVVRSRANEIEMRGGGFRYSTTVNGTLTGLGGDLFIVDDPIKAQDAMSEKARGAVNEWLGSTLASRANDKRTAKTILVMQRVHVDDPTAHMLDKGSVRHLRLPAVSDQDRIVALSHGKSYGWRAGEPLQAEREPARVLADLKASLGEVAFSAQYLQAPVPIDGGLLRWSWLRPYTFAPNDSEVDMVILSWDTAMTDTANADYTVCTVWFVSGNQYFLIDVIRQRLRYPDLKRVLVEQRRRYPSAIILMEEKGSGISILQELKSEKIGVIGIKPIDNKIARASQASAVIESGRVLVPLEAPWLPEFKTEYLAFPGGRHDDQIDSMAQAINWREKKRRRPKTMFGSY